MPAVIFAILTAFATSLLARVLIGAGLTLIVASAMDVTSTGLLNAASGHISGLPAVALDLILLGGVGTMLSIIGGALITKAALTAAGTILGVKLKGGAGV